MAEDSDLEKTEAATGKRIERARDDGNVVPSRELGIFIQLMAAVLGLMLMGSYIMEKLLALTPRPEHIVIETSGLALPKPLVKAFAWPEIRSKVTVDGVVTVVDGPAVAAGQFADDPARIAATCRPPIPSHKTRRPRPRHRPRHDGS